MLRVSQTENGVTIAIKVVSNASKDEISGTVGDRLKVRVKAPPENGKANKAVCQLLAKTLGLKVDFVSVHLGNTTPQKTIGIQGVSVDSVRSTLERV